MISLFQRRRFKTRTAVLGSLLAWSIIWIGALKFAPTAHAEIHHDALDSDHHCVVEVFSEGVLLDSPAVGWHASAARLATENAFAQVKVLETPTWLRPPGRAPPIG